MIRIGSRSLREKEGGKTSRRADERGHSFVRVGGRSLRHSSRYWIGQEDSPTPIDLGDVEAAFEDYDPSLPRRLLGDIFSLHFLKGLFGSDQE